MLVHEVFGRTLAGNERDGFGTAGMFIQIRCRVIDLEIVETVQFNLAKGNTCLPLNNEPCIFREVRAPPD